MTTASRPLRIAVVDDYEVVVAGIAKMFLDCRDRVEVVELDSLLPPKSAVDIILLDTFAFVDGRGVGLPQLVRADGPKVVVFTWPGDQRSPAAALEQGAVGYLSKALPADELVAALEAIHAGEVVSRWPDDPVPDERLSDWPGRDYGLTPRESEVLALIAQGLSNNEVAAALFLSINSVKSFIRSAYRRVGVESRSQAVLWALRHGFDPVATRTFPVAGTERQR